MKRANIIFFLCALAFSFNIYGQNLIKESERELKSLPEILVSKDAKLINNVTEWESIRRPEIVELFEEHMFGKVPDKLVKTSFEVTNRIDNALDGKAKLKEIEISLFNERDMVRLHLLIILPVNVDKSMTLFLSLNSGGNHTVSLDENITVTNNSQKARGSDSASWPIEEILGRGYGFATIYCGDMDPDFDDGFQNSIHPLFYDENQNQPKSDEWGTLAAWAYGLSKAMDYIETDSEIDKDKVAIIGHSRLGKAVLWAGAKDERFQMVLLNNSGSGGAALSRGNTKETIKQMNSRFPNWFCNNFKKYNDREEELPFDQHMLLALIAPRSVYVAGAKDDKYCDTYGEYLSLLHAGEVYQLYGINSIESETPPPINQPIVRGKMGWHIRYGDHGLTNYDWQQYLNFADCQFK